MANSEIANLRNNYTLNELSENNVSVDAIKQFSEWFKDALEAKHMEANAMVLSTIKNGRPTGRVVLLKGIENDGFVFFYQL